MREPPRRDENEAYFGMRRRPPGYADLRSAPGWEPHEMPDCDAGRWRTDVVSRSQLELRTPDGELYSRDWVDPDPVWQAAALRHGFVVCLWGLFPGLIGPVDMADTEYNPGDAPQRLRDRLRTGSDRRRDRHLRPPRLTVVARPVVVRA